MATYLVINLVVLVVVCTALSVQNYPIKRLHCIVLGILFLLTAVFDSLIIAAGIVAYDQDKLLGIFIGSAPIEDFFYPLLAVVIIPILWRRLPAKKGTHAND